MPASMEFMGRELPVHEPDTRVITSLDLRRGGIRDVTENFTLPKIVRAIDITLRDLSHAPASTAELLEATERELDTVAGLCGALVVGHQWGLYPLEGKAHEYRKYLPANQGLGLNIALPKNHILVAEVDVIKPGSPAGAKEDDWAQRETMQAVREAITEGVRTYHDRGKGTYQLFDMRYEPARSGKSRPNFKQFEWGVPVGSPAAEPEIYLTDIDPRFSLTR